MIRELPKHEILMLILPEIGIRITEIAGGHVKGYGVVNVARRERSYYVIQIMNENKISISCFNTELLKEIISKLKNIEILELYYYTAIAKLKEDRIK